MFVIYNESIGQWVACVCAEVSWTVDPAAAMTWETEAEAIQVAEDNEICVCYVVAQ